MMLIYILHRSNKKIAQTCLLACIASSFLRPINLSYSVKNLLAWHNEPTVLIL